MGLMSEKEVTSPRLPVISSALPEQKSIQNEFSRLEADCKMRLQEALILLRSYRGLDPTDITCESEEKKISKLIVETKEKIGALKAISEDMNAVYKIKSLSPRVVDQAKTYALSVESLQTTLRKLLVDFQHVSNNKHRQDLLNLTRSPFDEPRQRKLGKNAAGTAAGITNSLKVSQQILTETLQRSQGTMEQLGLTTRTIQDNQDELRSQSYVVNTAQKLLAKYGRREWTDKVLICLALCFFFACVLYVVQKRLF